MEPPPPEPHPSLAPAVSTWDRPIVMLPLFALIAGVGGLFGSFTLSADLLVLAVGGTLVWLGVSGRAGRREAPRRLPSGARWWLVPVLALGLVELFAFSHNDPRAYPTLSLLADPVLEGYLPRALAYFAWLTGFWALVRR